MDSTTSPLRDSPLRDLTHALSFDIEDWFHIVEIKAVEDPSLWPKLHSESTLVERYTDHILSICDTHNARATFFMLGWVADKHPQLVRRIADAGHELATHSFWHRKVYELTPEVFSQDIADSIDAIRAAPGLSEIPIKGFRAPSFSITPGTEWAFDVLLDHGIEYDASLFPAPRGHGGYACPQGFHVITAPSGRTMPELPMSVASYGPKKICYSGGGYMRLLPQPMIHSGVKQEAAAGRPTVVYLHPRDFAPDCPRVPMPPHRRFKCYVGTKTTTSKLESLLARYNWDTCQRVIDLARSAPHDAARETHEPGANAPAA